MCTSQILPTDRPKDKRLFIVDLDQHRIFDDSQPWARINWQQWLPPGPGKVLKARLTRAAQAVRLEPACGASSCAPALPCLCLRCVPCADATVWEMPHPGLRSDTRFLFDSDEIDYDSVELLNRRVRDAALRFMAELLAPYRNFMPALADRDVSASARVFSRWSKNKQWGLTQSHHNAHTNAYPHTGDVRLGRLCQGRPEE